MNKNEINDKRLLGEFKGMTFSKYKKTEVKKELIKNILTNKVEAACYWSIEFICAGLFAELWEIIFLIYSKHIHISNPKLPLYIEMRYNHFKTILSNGFLEDELKLRNNDKTRKLFAEMIAVLCQSPKRQNFTKIKIDKDDFNMTNLKDNLKAKNVSYAQKVFKPDDPQDLFIAVNEFAYCLSKKQKNTNDACYWIEWIFEYESKCKREKKVNTVCERRNVPVDSQYQMDVAWLIWETILKFSKKNIEMLILSMRNIYCSRFSPGVKRKRRFILYFAISLVCDMYNLNTKIVTNSKMLENIKKKIDALYIQIKQNEIRPDTDYLFNNSFTSGNLEKTIAKLEKMNTIFTTL
tara:strand:+ start:440 stop:1492 length:1053 start_codon:yes stop_codon:yes gene_type:complete